MPKVRIQFMTSKRFLIINGPNLNRLGARDTELYGKTTLENLNRDLVAQARKLKVELDLFQSNSEGELVDYIQTKHEGADGIVLNPAALTHAGYSLLDAVLDSGLKFVEVHISNVYAREKFRAESIFMPHARAIMVGMGVAGYSHALCFLNSLKD